MADWYYSRTEDEREDPISEEQLRAWIDDGTLTARTLVWQDGMADWQEVRRVFKAKRPSQAVTAIPDGPADATPTELPGGLQGWMLFIGIIAILFFFNIGFSVLEGFGR